jgi:hypothetical protein
MAYETERQIERNREIEWGNNTATWAVALLFVVGVGLIIYAATAPTDNGNGMGGTYEAGPNGSAAGALPDNNANGNATPYSSTGTGTTNGSSMGTTGTTGAGTTGANTGGSTSGGTY